ncbi:hypothetical protein DV515_00018692, partial [Chloebia gouldiae]
NTRGGRTTLLVRLKIPALLQGSPSGTRGPRAAEGWELLRAACAPSAGTRAPGAASGNIPWHRPRLPSSARGSAAGRVYPTKAFPLPHRNNQRSATVWSERGIIYSKRRWIKQLDPCCLETDPCVSQPRADQRRRSRTASLNTTSGMERNPALH